MSAHDGEAPDVDPVTGYETTGHDWNGIKELNTPFPIFVITILGLTVVYSIIAWLLLPAWPTGRDYTRGLLGLDQGEMAVAGYQRLADGREDWMARFVAGDFDAIVADQALMAKAMPAAHRLFLDNCAACHGTDATGGPGFPDLADSDWLWGGDPATIAETLRVGINSPHPETRFAQMPAFGHDQMLERAEIETLTSYVQALSTGQADPDGEGGTLFADNCASCHGDGGVGGLGIGAPSLVDGHWIYGGDRATIFATLQRGRQGVMPTWADRLSEAEINLLGGLRVGLAAEHEALASR